MPETLLDHVIYTRNEWNLPFYQRVLAYLRKESIVSMIDLGGCTGEVSIMAKELIPSLSHIIIVEPVEENFMFLQTRCPSHLFHVVKAAVYYGGSSVSLYQNDPNNMNVGGWSTFEKNQSNCLEEIRTIPLEDFPVCDFIKIDIEGGEENLLINSTNIHKFKYILLETHGNNRLDPEGFVRRLLPNHIIIETCVEQVFLKLKR